MIPQAKTLKKHGPEKEPESMLVQFDLGKRVSLSGLYPGAGSELGVE